MLIGLVCVKVEFGVSEIIWLVWWKWYVNKEACNSYALVIYVSMCVNLVWKEPENDVVLKVQIWFSRLLWAIESQSKLWILFGWLKIVKGSNVIPWFIIDFEDFEKNDEQFDPLRFICENGKRWKVYPCNSIVYGNESHGHHLQLWVIFLSHVVLPNDPFQISIFMVSWKSNSNFSNRK